MAASTRSFGMLTLLAFSMQRRRAGLVAGSGPPALTAMAISFPIRENCLAIRSQRANIVDFLTSNMRPIEKSSIFGAGAKVGFVGRKLSDSAKVTFSVCYGFCC